MAVERPEAKAMRVAALHGALLERNADRVHDILWHLRTEDAMDLLFELSPLELATAVTLLGDENLADLLENADAATAARLVLKLSRNQAADVLEEMDPDDATDIVVELEPEDAEAILTEMEADEAEDIRDLMTYPPNTAGGRMTPDFVAVSPDLNVAQALTALRQAAAEAETIYYVYVADSAGRLVGVLNLREIVLAAPERPVSELIIPDPVKVRVDADQEVAARLLAEHGFLAIPVVDAQDRLLGIITADDAADILEQEASEDIEKLGGSEALDAPYLRSGILDLAKKRVRWLLLLFIAATYTGNVLRHFEGELEQVISLTFFIPLLIGTGGNVGTQITTTLTRALAVGEVAPRDALRVLGKELSVAVLLGLLMAIGTLVRAWTLGVEAGISTVVAVTAVCIVVWAAAVAALLPLGLRRLRLDPAVASGPFVTTLVDGTGLIIYFEIARRLLQL